MPKMSVVFEVKTLTKKGLEWLPQNVPFKTTKEAWDFAQTLRLASNVRDIKFKEVV